jgi:hypothetical protein
MITSSTNLTKVLCTLAGPILFLAISAAAMVSSRTSRSDLTVLAEASPVSISTQSQNRLEAERITLGPSGFNRTEMIRPAGRFVLAINDRSEQTDTSIVLSRETGDRLQVVKMRNAPRRREWRKVIDLPPGRYVLADANYPERTCRILLTSN